VADRSIVVRLKAQVDDFTKGMAKAKASVDDLTKADVKKSSDAFSGLANKAALAGAGIAVGIGFAVKSFMDFDKQMSAAAAATDTTGAALDALRAAAIKAGNDTQFSATDAAKAITEMGKAGVSTADILGGGLTGALSLAAAGQLDVGAAGEIAATALNQFNLAGKDLPHVADLLAAGAGKAQGSVTDLSTALNYVGPVAHSMGISIDETVGVLAEFASAGLVGEQGGTAFRGMLSSLLSPSLQASNAMHDLGINLYDANGNFVGMQATAQILHDKLGGLDDATRNQALGQIFGNAQLAAATVLYQNGGQAVADWTAKVNDQGFAARQAAQLMDNLSGDLEKFSSGVETAFIQAGSGGNAALRSIVQGATGVVNSLGQIPGPVLLAGSALSALALVGPKAFLSFRQYKADLDAAGLSLAKISASAPRVGSALSAAATGAKALGVAFVVAAAASRAFDDNVAGLGLEQLVRDLNGSTDAVGVLNRTIAAGTPAEGLYKSNITDLGSALRYTFNPGFLDSADNSIRSLYAAVGGENSSDIKVASDRLTDLDASLAQLVQGGNGSKAADVMAAIQSEAQKQGISVDQLKAKFPQYAEALAAVTNQAGPAKDATAALSTAQDDAAQSAQDAAKANDALLQSLTAYANLVLGARDAARQYEQAVDAADAALKENGKTLDITTEKGRANQAAIDGIASATLGMVTHTFEARDANTSLADAVSKAKDEVQKGRDAFIDHATKMGLSRDAAARLADQLGLTKDNVDRLSKTIENVPDKTSKVDADIKPATTHLDQVQARLDGVGKQRPTPVIDANAAPFNAVTEGSQRKLAALDASRADPDVTAQDNASAILDRILGRVNAIPFTKNVTVTTSYVDIGAAHGRAAGGLIRGPGTTTSDSIPALLSNREYIVKAAAVDKYGVAMLDAINAGRYASGGMVQPVGLMTSGQGIAQPAVNVAGPAVDVYVQAVPDGDWVRSEARVVVREASQVRSAAARSRVR
jgi:TP901 family phage tail tape measure protein